jgi:hypothetical protein
LILCGCLLLVSAWLGACGGSSDEVLARVGSSPITKSIFSHWMSVANAMSPSEAQALFPDPSGTMTLKQRVLGFLIVSLRTIAEARRAGIAVAPGAAKDLLARIRFEQTHGIALDGSEPPSFSFARAETTSDRIWIVKVHTLTEELERRQLAEAEQQIAPAQIARYYATHKGEFVIPEKRDVAVIQSFTKANNELAKREIASGKSLLSVVARRNEEPAVGGYKRGLTRRELSHGYENDYFTAPPHVFIGPRQAEIYYLFEVTAIMPARQQRLAEVQALIRRKLVAGAQRQVYTSVVQAHHQEWRTKTRCRSAYMVAQCGGALT